MMKFSTRTLVRCALAAVLVSMTATDSSAAISVNGTIGDWGSTGVFTNDSWLNGLDGSEAGFNYKFHNDDLAGNAGNGVFLGPNFGGQNYDAEFLGVGSDATKLYIVIVTGQRPDNGATNFSPGDIRIVTSTAVFGIEVGGGGTAGKTFAINNSTGYTDTSYNGTLNGSSFTGGVATDTTSHLAGTLWKNGNWTSDPLSSGPPVGEHGAPNFDGNEPVQLQFTGGIAAGAATSFIYNTAAGTEHAVIELAIDLNLFSGIINQIQWAPGCGNDFVYVNNLGIHSPEPATLVMGLLGVAGVAGLRRFRRQDA